MSTAANSIRVIHERDDKDDVLEQARSEIVKADRVVFLGFGYHSTNMQRIGCKMTGGNLKPGGQAWGTFQGLSNTTQGSLKTARLRPISHRQWRDLTPQQRAEQSPDIWTFLQYELDLAS